MIFIGPYINVINFGIYMYKKYSLSQGTIKYFVQKYIFLVLLVPVIVISVRLFIHPGVLIGGDFPSFDAYHYSLERLWLWVDKGSYSGFENLARFPMLGIWALLSLFSVSFEASTKFMIILGFSLCSFSFYFSFYYLLKNRIRGITELKLSIALIIGSIFYAYNIWSFARIDHYYLWIGYSILPIFFVSLVFSFQRFKLKYIIIAALTLIIASSTPHMILFYGVVLTITFLSFFIYYLGKKKFKPVLYSATTLVSLFFLFIIMNLYWILPYVLSSVTSSESIAPTYVLNLEMADVLSRDSNFLNALRLTADWIDFGINYEPSPPTSILHSLWLFSSYLFPVLAISSFILWVKKIKYSLILFVFFVIGLVLAMGTNIPFDYFSILFTTPILGKIAWVFRDPDKWSFLIAFSYSFFITLFSIFIFNLFSNRRSRNIIVSSTYIVLIVSSIAIFAYPVYNYTIEERYNSINLPEDFNNLNNYLSTLDTQKVFFMPYSDNPPYWSLNHTVTGIYQLVSSLPNNQIYYPVQKNYYNYFIHLIQNNQIKEGISNFIYPFGTSYLIYHNDTISEDDLSFSNNVYNLSDLHHDKNIGFFDVFKLPKNQSSVDIMNTNNNIAVVQGLDKLSLLNKIKSYSSTNSSVLFLDQNPSQNITTLNYFNNIIMEPSFLNLVFPFMPSDYFVSPFVYTYHNDPSLFWSRVNAIDSLHGEFHPYLQPVGIDNWDLDYRKGIVITQASDAKLDIPIKIDKDDQYDLFIRYLENFRGGNIKIFLDDNLINEINTQGGANEFVWKKIWSNNLTKGQHKLTIENTNGFNAINTFAIVPHSQFEQSMSAIIDKTDGMNPIYLMDQADFESFGNNKYVTNTNYTTSVLVPLFNTANSNMTMIGNKISNTSGTVVLNSILNTPVAADMNSLTLNFENKFKSLSSSNNNQTTNPIRSIDLIPTSQKIVYHEDYENRSDLSDLFGDDLSSALSNPDNPVSNIYIDRDSFIPGNSSLRIDMKMLDTNDSSDKSYIITHYLPIDDNVNLKFKAKVKAFDANVFYPIAYFYDSNQTLLGESVIDQSIDGSFEKEYDSTIVPPRNTEFIQIAFLFLPNANSKSSFLIDDIEVTEIIPSIHLDNLGIADEYFTDMHIEQLIHNDTNDNKSSSLFSLVQTRPIPVVNDASYTYSIDVNDENIDSMKSYALFRESNQPETIQSNIRTTTPTTSTDADVITDEGALNQIRDTINDNGMGYILHKNIDIIKSGNYSFDFQFYNTDTGGLEDKPIKLVIDGVETDYQSRFGNDSNSNSNSSPYNTFSLASTIYLQKGTHQIELTMSDLKTKLDFALIYPVNSENTDANHNSSTLPFSDQSTPAHLSNYTIINPTKHIVKIDNATKPFVLLFSETYDPLWTASIVGDDNGDNSDQQSQTAIDDVPLSSIVNGFLINKTGNFDVVIEYKPQDWYYTGLIISIIVLILLAVTVFIYYYKTNKSKPRQ